MFEFLMLMSLLGGKSLFLRLCKIYWANFMLYLSQLIFLFSKKAQWIYSVAIYRVRSKNTTDRSGKRFVEKWNTGTNSIFHWKRFKESFAVDMVDSSAGVQDLVELYGEASTKIFEMFFFHRSSFKVRIFPATWHLGYLGGCEVCFSSSILNSSCSDHCYLTFCSSVYSHLRKEFCSFYIDTTSTHHIQCLTFTKVRFRYLFFQQ